MEALIQIVSSDHSAINISLINDGIFEDAENFQASLQMVGSPLPRVSISPAAVNFSIFDDDGKKNIKFLHFLEFFFSNFVIGVFRLPVMAAKTQN